MAQSALAKKRNKIKPKKQISPQSFDEIVGTAKDHSNELLKGYSFTTELVSPSDIQNWNFPDRSEFDYGDLNELADSIRSEGQHEPIKIRPSSGEKKYEVIAGERRWRAGSLIQKSDPNFQLVCLIKDMTDQEALRVQRIENKKHLTSDYAMGVFIQNVLNRGVVSREELCSIYDMSITKLKSYLSFCDVENKFPEITTAIGDLSMVSARTMSEIKAAANKGSDYVEVIVAISDQIREGIGEKLFKRLLNQKLNTRKSTDVYIVKTSSGTPIFKWNRKTISFEGGFISKLETARKDEMIEKIKLLIEKEFTD